MCCCFIWLYYAFIIVDSVDAVKYYMGNGEVAGKYMLLDAMNVSTHNHIHADCITCRQGDAFMNTRTTSSSTAGFKSRFR